MESSLLSQVLDTYGAKLGIDDSSEILVDAAAAGTLLAWLASRHITHPHLPGITATGSDSAFISERLENTSEHSSDWQTVKLLAAKPTDLPLASDMLTHTIAHTSNRASANSLQTLKEIHRTLRPKGIAILTYWDAEAMLQTARKVLSSERAGMAHSGPPASQEAQIKDRLEAAGWERGKVRAMAIRMRVKAGAEVDELVGLLQDELCAAHLGDESSRASAAVRQMVEDEMGQCGGLVIEGWGVVAMKWDLLCA